VRRSVEFHRGGQYLSLGDGFFRGVHQLLQYLQLV